ncbi:MAG TPA: ABC transporter permease [Jiangellales bacterium]|nr:ABC transporter permease [Jiangellales bacterium]
MTTRESLAPRPGAAPLPRMVAAQTRFELRQLLRNGEQLLLTLVIPLLLLAALAAVPVVDLGGDDLVDTLVPGVLALSVMSTAFTSLAIATGFERRYGVLKRLAASPLPRWGLLVAKAATVLVVELVQVLLVCALGLALGWAPGGSLAAAALLVLAGTAAFAALALLMAGTLRAEATLAAANLVYVLLLVGGAVVVPLDRYPEGVQPLVAATPSGALAEGLRAVLARGEPLPWTAVAVLAGWALVAGAAAARWFRWE